MILELILVAGGAYLLGSIPFGVLFCRWLRGLDPLEHGSKNIGFTNVLRIAGWFPGLLTLTGDMGKGFLSVTMARQLNGEEMVMLIAGLAVVLGHNHSLFLRCRGGKGVATGFGALLGLNPLIGFVLLTLWAAVVGIWRISSLGAIICFALLPGVIWWFEQKAAYLIFAFILSMMILLRHRSNMVRLWQGVEQKLGGS